MSVTQRAEIEKQRESYTPGYSGKSYDTNNEDSVDCKYGWCGLKTGWMQRFNTSRWLLVFLCLFAFIQGMIINGFVNVVITSLEKRFDLPSKKSGLIASTYEIASAVVAVFISYYGERNHKARIVASGCVIMALGSILFSLPHFTTGLHTNTSGSLVCERESLADDCRGSESSVLSIYLYVFILSQILHGVGVMPLYTIGLTLLDESITVHQSGLYLGILFGVSSLGPAVGYVIGGILLDIYTDIGQIDINSLDVTPSDPGWVGAWWLGFLISGIIAFFVAVPISGYPRELPKTSQIRSRKVSQAHVSSGGEELLRFDFGDKLSDFPRALKYLLVNPTFVFLGLVGCCEGMVVTGFATFGPKVIENQFGKTAGDASLLMGFCAIPGAGVGTLLGGYLIKRWQLKVRGMIKFSCCTCIVALVAFLGILLRCPQEQVVGVNLDYLGNKDNTSQPIWNGCNSECVCTRSEFNPVCGDNGLEYISPCFAGCSVSSDSAESFTECSCLAVPDTPNTTLTTTSGKCPTECNLLPIFLASLVILMTFHFMTDLPGIAAVLRCVPDNQRSLAMGVNWIVIKLLGTIPGPLVFGAALDSSCLLWQEDCSGDQGSCFLYSGKSISWIFFLLGFGFKFLSLIFFLLALWTYKTSDDMKEEVRSSMEWTSNDASMAKEEIRSSIDVT